MQNRLGPSAGLPCSTTPACLQPLSKCYIKGQQRTSGQSHCCAAADKSRGMGGNWTRIRASMYSIRKAEAVRLLKMQVWFIQMTCSIVTGSGRVGLFLLGLCTPTEMDMFYTWEQCTAVFNNTTFFFSPSNNSDQPLGISCSALKQILILGAVHTSPCTIFT